MIDHIEEPAKIERDNRLARPCQRVDCDEDITGISRAAGGYSKGNRDERNPKSLNDC